MQEVFSHVDISGSETNCPDHLEYIMDVVKRSAEVWEREEGEAGEEE